MPHFGHHHDDSLYLISSRSLAGGEGYRISSLPGKPHQTKYPPGYAVYLLPAWWFGMDYPGNLRVVTFLNWLLLPLLLLLSRWYFPQARWWMFGLALSSYVVFVSISAMTELLATCLLLASLGMARHRSPRLVFVSGLLGAAAFLVKTAMMVLVVAAPLSIVLFQSEHRRRNALIYMAAMLPAILGWQWWAGHHRAPANPDLQFYTDYVAFWKENVTLGELPGMMLINLRAFVSALGSLFWYNPTGGMLDATVGNIFAFAAIAGIWRSIRQPSVSSYAIFAVLFVAQLLLWNATPNERLILPLFPFLMAGLAAAHGQLVAAFEKSRVKQPGSAWIILAIWCCLLACAGIRNGYGLRKDIPGILARAQTIREEYQELYRWIRDNTKTTATFLASDDGLLFLETGRSGLSKHLPSRLFYREDKEGKLRYFGTLPELPIDYVLVGPSICQHDLAGGEREQIRQHLAREPRLHLQKQIGNFGIYQNKTN